MSSYYFDTRMIKSLLFLGIMMLCYLSVVAQEEPLSEMISVQTSGAAKGNRGEVNKEFFGQTRTLLLGLSIGTKSTLQTGISRSRVGNEEILEFPILYRHQVTETISAYGGVQAQFSRNLNDGISPSFIEFSPTIGVDVQFTPIWDGGVQFVMPLMNNSAVPKVNYERTQPIRLRTGIKF